jgi:hypothetical protein
MALVSIPLEDNEYRRKSKRDRKITAKHSRPNTTNVV